MIAHFSRLAAIGVLFMVINVSHGASLRGQQFQQDLEEIDLLESEVERELQDSLAFFFDSSNVVELPKEETFTDDKDVKDDDFAEARIVGGYDVSSNGQGIPNAFAAILRDAGGGYSFSNCGATLITACHVATAAHCVSGRQGENDAVYINARQMNNAYNMNGGNVYHFTTVVGQTMHSSYTPGSKSNDVAILTLAECVPADKISQGIEIATFGDAGVCQQNGLVAAGYGRTNQDSYTKPNVLQAVTLDYISNTVCNANYGGLVDGGMMCAGYTNGGKDSCQGDSGGPLFSYDRRLCGIVSWGSGCAQAGKPGVYASAVYYRQWFKDQACQDGRLPYPTSLCL